MKLFHSLLIGAASVSIISGFLLGTIFGSQHIPVRTLENQRICVEAAEKYFQTYTQSQGYGASQPRFGRWEDTLYTAHYNTKLARCFVFIKHFEQNINVSNSHDETLLDVFSNKSLGTIGDTEFLDKYINTQYCVLTPALQHEKLCSQVEWDAYVASYMRD